MVEEPKPFMAQEFHFTEVFMATQVQIDNLIGLYVGYFDRSPDPAGLQFWISQVDNGRDITTIAQDFARSEEAKSLYPYLANPSNSSPLDFISSIYQNLFNRLPEAAGLSFWYDALTQGTVSVGDMIEAILQGARGTDATVVENKIEVAFHWTTNAPEKKGGFTFDADAAAAAKAALSDIDQWQNSVDRAKEQTETYVAGEVHTPVVTPVVAEPQTFFLTREADNFTGNSAGDTFIAAPGTLQEGDVLNGGSGSDVLELTMGFDFGGMEGFPSIIEPDVSRSSSAVTEIRMPESINRLDFGTLDISNIETAEIKLFSFIGPEDFTLENLSFETVNITGAGNVFVTTTDAALIDASDFHGTVYLNGSEEADTLIGSDSAHLYYVDTFIETEYMPSRYTNTFNGGAGADDMTGGAGTDVFVFVTSTDSTMSDADTVRDFTAGIDKLDFSFLSTFYYLGEAKSYDEALARLHPSYTGPDDVFHSKMSSMAFLDTTSSTLYVDLNGDGALSKEDMAINLNLIGDNKLSSYDFMFN